MSQRNSCKKNQLPNITLRRSTRSLPTKPPDPEVIFRRSPRFRKVEPHDSVNPKTPLVKSNPLQSPFVSTRRKRSNKNPKEQVSEKSNLERNRELGRRMTRSCSKDNDIIAKKIDYGDSTGNMSVCKTREVSKCLRVKPLNKNKVKENEKCRKDDSERDDEGVVYGKVNEEVLLVKECHVLDDRLCEKEIDIEGLAKRVGVKRKRGHKEKGVGIGKGWTKDQELALERAYLTAKPTPHFWKKVSRMVTGKSAQECFNKVHCCQLTPPQPRTRSRAVGLVSHNSNLSPSKLLDSPFQKAKRPCNRKKKSHILQRTVRHMLQKQSKVEKDSEADLFLVLEPTSNPTQRLVTTPDCAKFKVVFPKKWHEGSSTARKKSHSRFSSSHETPIISPPVLKPVKNMVLHEKYIDQLNCREANRRARSTKQEKLHKSKGGTHDSSVQRKEAIKAAKFALVFDAKDAINKFQDQQARALSSIFDDEIGSDDEEDGQDLF
uniref:uncharacterized protein LOC122589794 n=1 Tax=Erigeron canadensis TaxID=72917 RepID=UPI001CB96C26|nr:uncharacterized protein LOC122589794 [Erigeron canadensis]